MNRDGAERLSSRDGAERLPIVHAIAIAGALFALDPAGPTLERYHLAKEALIAGCAVVLAVVAIARRRAVALDALDLALAALVAVDLAASLGTIDRDVAGRGALLTAVLAALALDLRGRSPEFRERIGAIALGLAALAALVVIAESYGHLPRISLPSYAPGATIGQRNNAGHVLAIALAACAGIALRARAGGTRAVAIAMIPVFATAIVLTRSRAAWLATLVGAFVAIVLAVRAGSTARRAVALRAAIVIAVLACGAAVPLAARPRLAWRQASPYADTAARLLDAQEGSGRGRLVQWRTSIALAEEHPLLGVGPGHWAIHYPRVAAEGDPTVHREAWAPTSRLSTSDPVAWLVERGALGLVALVALLGLVLRRLAHERDAPRLAALAALLSVSALDCALQIAPGVVALALLVPARAGGEPRRGASLAVIAIVAVALAGAPRAMERAWIAYRGERAELAETERLAERDPWNVVLRTRLAEHALFAGDCRTASRWLEELARLRPFHPRVRHDRDACRGAHGGSRAPAPAPEP